MFNVKEALNDLIDRINDLSGKYDSQVVNVSGTQSISAGSSVEFSVPVPSYVKNYVVSVDVNFDASATGGADIELYYSMDGENFDTIPGDSFDISVAAGQRVQMSKGQFQVKGKYVKIVVKNNDSSVTLTLNRLDVMFL